MRFPVQWRAPARLAACALAALELVCVPPAAAESQTFGLLHVVMQQNAAQPTACLRFSQKLSSAPGIHYGDYLSFSPDIKPAITVTGSELCLGGLDYTAKYTLTLRAGLPDAAGEKLAAPQKLSLQLADRPSLVAISGDGYILSRDTANGLTIQTVNVKTLKIHLLRMSDKLLPATLGNGPAASNVQLGMQTTDPWMLHSLAQNQASVIWTGTMDVAEDHNRTVSTAFPIASLVPPGRDGLYMVVAEDAAHALPDKLYTDPNYNVPFGMGNSLAAHWVVATDIALTSMEGTDGLHVFARSLASAKPLAGVKIRLISTGQDTLGEQVTDGSGAVLFPAGLLAGQRANAPATLVAYGDHGNFAFQDLSQPAFDLSDRGVSGRAPPHNFQAFLYTDRGIYRPGEIVNLVALLRDRMGDAVKGQPLKILLRRPDGVVDRGFVLQPAEAGGFLQPIKLSATAARGSWTVEAYVDPTGAPVGQAQIDVQDFVPQQLRVDLSTTQKWAAPSDAITATLDGKFLYGAPAAGLHAQGDLAVMRDDNPVPGATGYRFGLVDDKVETIDNQVNLDDADDKGHLDISSPLPDLLNTTAPLKAVLSAGLLEPSGRYVGGEVDVPIRAQSLLIGIKPLFSGGQVQEGEAPRFNIQSFDDAGKSVSTAGLRWTLVEEDPVFDWFQDNGSNWTWHFHTEDHQLASGTLDAPVGGHLNFVPAGFPQFDWGTYRLIVADQKTGAATSVRFNIGWNTAGGSASTPDKAEVSLDKALAAPGDVVKLHIKGPFAGKAQIVIANDRIFSTKFVDVPKGGLTLPITVDGDWGAGAYAVVTMYRPLAGKTDSGGPTPPVRALGLAWIGIDPSAHKLAVSVEAPDKITPRQTITVPVKIGGVAAGARPFVTLSGVDEGILQLTGFTTPDPLSYLYGKLALGMDIRDDYGHLLDGSADAGAIHNGGDAGIGGAGLPVESTKVVSLFSGRVQVGADGVARIPVQVPDFEGQLRFMAVAYDDTQVGSAASDTIVRDPVIEDVSLPRFMAPGDSAQLAVSLHNTDGASGAYHLALKISGPASLNIGHKLDYQLAAGQRVQDAVTLDAKSIGIITLDAVLTGPGGYHVERTWQMAVRSPHYPTTQQSVAEQQPGETYKADQQIPAQFLPGSAAVNISYAGYKGIDVTSLLQSLWLYPFGCTEQLSSTSFPLLYYNETALLGRIGDDDDGFQDTTDEGVHARVQQAIDTILDRQDETGEFGLWRVGDGEASPWLNAYALDFLLHAKAVGYDVPDDAVNRAYSHMHSIVSSVESGQQGGDNSDGADSSVNAEVYAEYLLTQAGQGDAAILRRLHDNSVVVQDSGAGGTQHVYWLPNSTDDTNLASPLALAQLSAALDLIGDSARASDTMKLAIMNIGVSDYPSWWWEDGYYSATRDIAGMIAIAGQEGDVSLAGTLLDRLNALDVKSYDMNTQEKAWLLAAAASLDKQAKTIDLTVDGKQMQNLKLPANFTPTARQLTAGYGIRNDGQKPVWRTVTITGAPATAPPASANGFTLDVAYYTLDGKMLDPSHLRQNDRFIVSLSGQSTDDEDHRAVLVDMLPAGWEIETPIRDDGTDYSFLGALSKTSVMEARDDRFVAAFNLGDGWQDGPTFNEQNDDNSPAPLSSDQFAVAFIVRVVTPGHFILPEAVVSDMYQPALMASTDAGTTQADPR